MCPKASALQAAWCAGTNTPRNKKAPFWGALGLVRLATELQNEGLLGVDGLVRVTRDAPIASALGARWREGFCRDRLHHVHDDTTRALAQVFPDFLGTTGGTRTRSLSFLKRAIYHFSTVACTCRRLDLHQHGLSATAFSTLRVCYSTTSTRYGRQDSNLPLRDLESHASPDGLRPQDLA